MFSDLTNFGGPGSWSRWPRQCIAIGNRPTSFGASMSAHILFVSLACAQLVAGASLYLSPVGNYGYTYASRMSSGRGAS